MGATAGPYRLWLLLVLLLQFALVVPPSQCDMHSSRCTKVALCSRLRQNRSLRAPGGTLSVGALKGRGLSATRSRKAHSAFVHQQPLLTPRPCWVKLRMCSTAAGATKGVVGEGVTLATAPATAPALEDSSLSLLDRVQIHQDAAAAELLLRQWEQQRDALLLTSWDSWAAAVGVSVQQLQQVVLLVHNAASSAKQHHRRRRPAAAATARASQASTRLESDAAVRNNAAAGVAGEDRSKSSSETVSCAGGVLSGAAYELLLQLLHAEAALQLKGPQSSRLLGLHRPPSVKEWASGAAADAVATDAARSTAAALKASAGGAGAADAAAELRAETAPCLHIRHDLTAEERQQRAALHSQLGALHLLISWQQQQLAATAATVVRRFRGVAAARQEQWLAAADLPDAATAATAATAAGVPRAEDLLLVALKHAREGLKKHALDNLHLRHLAAVSGAVPASAVAQHEGNADGGGDSRRGTSTVPSWVVYWGWMQQGMVRWSRLQRVPYDIPLSWWTTAAALRRLRHQQESEELQLQHQQQFFTPGAQREEEATQRRCNDLSISPQKLKSIQIATKKPISTDAVVAGHTPDKGERRDRVGELLVADESAREQGQQQMQLQAAAEEVWRFAAANLEPEQLQMLQQAANSPFASELHQRDPLLRQAVQQLRDAELKRLMQQLPEKQRVAAAGDPDMQRRLLVEQSHMLRLVRDACSQ